MSLSNLAAIFVEHDIVYPVQTVFDLPIPPIEDYQLLRAGLFRGEVDDAEDTFCALLSGLDRGDLPFDLTIWPAWKKRTFCVISDWMHCNLWGASKN